MSEEAKEIITITTRKRKKRRKRENVKLAPNDVMIVGMPKVDPDKAKPLIVYRAVDEEIAIEIGSRIEVAARI